MNMEEFLAPYIDTSPVKAKSTLSYIKQTDSYSCVPVAIANAINWSNDADYGDIMLVDLLRDVCATKETTRTRSGGVKKAGGTGPGGITAGIASRPELELQETVVEPSIKDIKRHLDAGGAVILCYKNWKTKYTGHSVLIDKRRGNNYHVVNGRGSDVCKWEDNVYIRKILSRKAQGGYKSHAYLINKGNYNE